ncbi:MAG TPA: GGDEF domain-containing protein [Polyangiaceae bacterium]|jgi:diguanylate cyclase (GGDEF)-like protein
MAEESSRPPRPSGAPRTLNASDRPDLSQKILQRIKAPHRPVLVVLSGHEVGARVFVDRNLLIGRDPSADLKINDSLVSWHHARIEDRGDSWTLIDLNSTNGTSVNGQIKPEFQLSPNDRIVFGTTIISFEVQDGLAQAYNETVEHLLNTDDLSGLYVRRKFDAELRALIDAARVNRDSVALLVMDLDGVKRINDTHGHLFGAYVIGEAGRLIGSVITGRGIGSRFGGDEYLAALPRLDTTEAAAVGEEIRQAVASHRFEKDGIELKPGISIGVAGFPEHADSPEGLFQRADEALYRAKQSGKNQVCLCEA